MPIKRFMIVDQSDETLASLKGLLGEMKFSDVSLCKAGKEALELLEPKNVEFLIVAWDMAAPMTGTAFIQQVKAKPAFRFLPTVTYSARLKPEDIRLMQDLGIANILPFPFEREVAATLIRKIVGEEDKLDPTMRKLRQAGALLADKKNPEALGLVKECLAAGPHFVTAHTVLGDIYIRLADYAEAEKALNIALEKQKTHTPAKQLMARVLSKTGRHQDAIQVLQQLVNVSPKNVSSLVSLGAAFTEADQMDKAKQALSQAKDIDPDSQEVKDGLGTVAFKEGNFEMAKELLAKTENSEEVARNLNNVAIGLIAKNEFEKGVNFYKAALGILSDNTVLHLLKYNLGLAYQKQGQLLQALTMQTEAFLQNPTFEKAYAAIVRLVKDMNAKNIAYDKSILGKIKAAREKASPKSAA